MTTYEGLGIPRNYWFDAELAEATKKKNEMSISKCRFEEQEQPSQKKEEERTHYL